jgi:hypothetical protein
MARTDQNAAQADTSVESTWQQALQENFGDYAYSPDGGGINLGEDGTYTVMNGNLSAACAGNWDEVERKGLSKEEIPGALEALKIPATGWSCE